MDTLNVTSNSPDWRAARLSNFSADPFELDRQKFASVEGFIQGIKFHYDDDRRLHAFELTGMKAKKIGRLAKRDRVWWDGMEIIYGSMFHHSVIARAIAAKFEQNRGALAALIATRGLTLTHNTGTPEPADTCLPATIFCTILTNIRQDALKKLPKVDIVNYGTYSREARIFDGQQFWSGYGTTDVQALGELLRLHPEIFLVTLDIQK